MKNKLITLLSISTIVLTQMSPPIAYGSNLDDDFVFAGEADCEVEIADTKKSDKDTPSNVQGDWLTEGTEEFKVAQEIFDIATEEYGLSGAFAASLIANARGESALIPDRSEGAGIIRFGMDSKEPPANEGGGGGLWQFTHYSKFTNSKWWAGRSGTKGWDVANQVDAIWGLEFANRAVWMYASSTDPSYGAAHYGKTIAFKSLEEWISTDDPAEAALAFQVGYERPAVYHAEREDWARQANAVFNKDNVKADKSKWKFDGGSGSEIIDATDSKKDKSDKEDECGVEEEETFGGGWGNDGTGSHSYNNFDRWKHGDLPKDLQDYAINPELVDMKHGSGDGWTNAGGQCVHFASSFLYALWHKDGKPNPAASGPSGGVGTGVIYGRGTAESYAKAYSGSTKTTKKFSKGAIVSIPPMTPESPGFDGHVWIVSHVFENGDVLVIEQNMPGYSGDGDGRPNTWNYRIATKSYLDGIDYKVYTPADDGYEVNEAMTKGEKK